MVADAKIRVEVTARKKDLCGVFLREKANVIVRNTKSVSNKLLTVSNYIDRS